MALLGGFSPDIVLLELDMPDTDIYRLAQVIRTHAQAHLCRLRLIAVAKREAHALGDLARAASFDGYLAKPIRTSALDHLLQNLRR
jgi:CheY-like chemotaxis protein